MKRLSLVISLAAGLLICIPVLAQTPVGPIDKRDMPLGCTVINWNGARVVCGVGVPSDTAFVDVAQVFTRAQRGVISTLSLSGTIATPSFDLAQNFSLILDHTVCPCVVANPSTALIAGQSGMISIKQSLSGNDLITWGTLYKHSEGVAPVLSTTANAVDHFPYYVLSPTQIVVGGGVFHAQ